LVYDVGRRKEDMSLKDEVVKLLNLVIRLHGDREVRRVCHYWSICGESVDLYRVKDGVLVQTGTISKVEGVEEVEG
jgi:hypothetical protein